MKHFVPILVISLMMVGDAFAGAGWTSYVSITEINQQPPGGVGSNFIFVETTATSATNPSGCAYASGFYFAVTDDRTKRIFATLLAAQLAGRNVRFFVNGTCHNPWNYAQLDGLVTN